MVINVDNLCKHFFVQKYTYRPSMGMLYSNKNPKKSTHTHIHRRWFSCKPQRSYDMFSYMKLMQKCTKSVAQRDDVSSVSDLGNSRNKSLEKNLFPTFRQKGTHKRALVGQSACANFYLSLETDLRRKISAFCFDHRISKNYCRLKIGRFVDWRMWFIRKKLIGKVKN